MVGPTGFATAARTAAEQRELASLSREEEPPTPLPFLYDVLYTDTPSFLLFISQRSDFTKQVLIPFAFQIPFHQRLQCSAQELPATPYLRLRTANISVGRRAGGPTGPDSNKDHQDRCRFEHPSPSGIPATTSSNRQHFAQVQNRQDPFLQP